MSEYSLPEKVKEALLSIENCTTDYTCEDGCCDEVRSNHSEAVQVIIDYMFSQADALANATSLVKRTMHRLDEANAAIKAVDK